jgi:hypothetical protein
MTKIVNVQHIGKLPLLEGKKLLAIGKGPTSKFWKPEYLELYNTIGINHTAIKFKTQISHFTDYEMFKDQSEHSEFVICPAFMNYEHKTTKNLLSLIKEDENMKILYKQKRLFSYDITTPDGFTTNLFKNNYPFLFKYASGVLIVQIAIFWKVEELFTLGIDGGTQYNLDFVNTKGNGKFLDEQLTLMEKLADGKIRIVKL